MNLNDYSNNIKENNYGLPLGDLTPCITNDGSLSLNNTYYNEWFHSSSGARKEAQEKFISPAEINRLVLKDEIRVLDLCFGLGYNSACLIEELLKQKTHLNLWGLEIDQRPLATAINNPVFRKSWSPTIIKILESINFSGDWIHEKSHGKILWGDARKKILALPSSLDFDLIFHDAFSPTKCPQLWSEEFLFTLIQKLAPEGRLITYSSSAAIRGTLKRAGLIIKSIIPCDKKRWSNGTIGINTKLDNEIIDNAINLRPLSRMEQEHLLTNAAIPFRDPYGNGSPKEILQRRTLEQKIHKFQSTSSWRKRWKKLLSG